MGRPEVDGPNSGYAALLLEQYLDNPGSVPEEWRDLFESDPAAVIASQPGLARLLELASNGTCCAASASAGSGSTARAAVPDAGAARRGRRGDGARQGDPDARAPQCPARPARGGAARRPGARAASPDPEAHARAAGAHPRLAPSPPRRGRDARRRAAAAPRDVHGDDRVRDRAHLRPRGARLAAAGDRVGPLPQAAHARRARPAARPAEPGRGDGALPPPRLPRAEAVLRRGARRDDPDARRGDRARRGSRRARGRDRDGAPRPPQRPRARRRPAVRGRPPRVRGRANDRGSRLERGGRQRRREVPPRRAGHALDAGRRHHDHARLQPEPPRGRRSRRRGTGAREADRPLVAGGLLRPDRRAPDPHPRRRRLRRPGDRRGDASTSRRSPATRPAARST